MNTNATRSPVWPLVAFPTAKLTLHLATLSGYGVFRDELYYIVCSERLGLAYVDHPPLSMAVLAGWRAVSGDGLEAMRVLPALFGALTVLVVGLIARRIRGGAIAQAVAMAGALAAPVFLALHHFYSMNALSGLIWATAALLLVEIERRQAPRLWIVLGALLGVGLWNKIDVLWFGAGLAVALFATDLRRWLGTRWPWLAGTLALGLFAPHLVWQAAHDWPTIEFVRNATGLKMRPVAPIELLGSQVGALGVGGLPIWLAGLGWLFVAPAARPHRALGWIWATVLGLLVVTGSSRSGYLAPAALPLFAAGGVALEALAARRGRPRLALLALVPALGLGAVTAPFALPLLSVDDYVQYAAELGVEPSTAERKELWRLPQFYADMHGWDRVVDAVETAAAGLSPVERDVAVVFAGNYGVASAVNVLGRERGLPPAISGHNHYWIWGPGDATGEVVLKVGGERSDLTDSFASVEAGAVIDCGDCMPYENGQTVWVARGPRVSMEDVWPRVRHYD